MSIFSRIIGVNEAGELWGLSPGTVKNMCAEGHVVCKKVGKTWIIDARQPTPVRRPARVQYSRKKKDPALLAAALEAQPAPLEDDDFDYFQTLYRERIERDGLPPEEAEEQIRIILRAYEFGPDDVNAIFERIRAGADQ